MDTDTEHCCPTASASIDKFAVMVTIAGQTHELSVTEAIDLMIDLGHAVGECKLDEPAGLPALQI